MNNQIVKLNYHKNIEKFFKSEDIDKKEENFYISGFIATTHIDATKDKITKEALEKALNYIKENGYFTVLFNHDLNRPIGKIVNLELKELPDNEYGLYVDILISKTEQEIMKKIEEGILNKFSIGAYGVIRQNENYDFNVIEDLNIFECSVVSVPANPKASISNYFVKFLSKEELENAELLFKQKEDKKIKVSINTEDVDFTPWSQVDKIKIKNILFESGDKRAIKECFGIVRSYERMGDWKFPHHILKRRESNSYELILSYTGLMAAYKAFRGARTKPKITSEEKESLRKHLLRHFRYLVSIEEYEEVPETLKKDIEDIKNIIKDLETFTFENVKNLENLEIKLDENLHKELETMADNSYKEEDLTKSINTSLNDMNISTNTENINEQLEDEELIIKETPVDLESYLEEDEEDELYEEDEQEEDDEDENTLEVSLSELKEYISVVIEETIKKCFNEIKEELKSLIKEVNEQIDKKLENLNTNITKTYTDKVVVQVKGEEEKISKEEDIDLEDFIYSDTYKSLDIKSQLDVLRVLFQVNLNENQKKSLIKKIINKKAIKEGN